MIGKLYSSDFKRGGEEGMISPIYQAILARGIKQSDLDRSLQRTAPPAIIQNNDFTKDKALSKSFDAQTRRLKHQSRLWQSETRRNNDISNMGNFWRLTQRYKYLRALESAEWSSANSRSPSSQQDDMSRAEPSDDWSSHLKDSRSDSVAQQEPSPLTETTKVHAADTPTSLIDASTLHESGEAVKNFFEVFSPGACYGPDIASVSRRCNGPDVTILSIETSIYGLIVCLCVLLLLCFVFLPSVHSASGRHEPRAEARCCCCTLGVSTLRILSDYC